MKVMSRVMHGCNPRMAEDRRARGVQGYARLSKALSQNSRIKAKAGTGSIHV